MWHYHPEFFEVPVPRYTSYPTAAEFQDVASEQTVDALDHVAPGTLASLYLHIPYCQQICWYCGCNTGAVNRPARLDAYLDALRQEISMVADRVGKRVRIGQIAFGGGSPNALSVTAFQDLVQHVKQSFNVRQATFSTEIDPRIMSRQWAEMLGQLGQVRVSLGVQTFSPHVQRAIGRVQSIELVEQVMEWLREAGIGSINFDLMYGLPGQSLADLRETLRSTITMAPDRVALFGYAHVPHLIPRQRKIDAEILPDIGLRFLQAELGYRSLVGSGYMAIGFDHFARPEDPLARAAGKGALRRNFQGFTEDSSEILIGLGASAISHFPDRIVQNEKNTGHYRMKIAAGRHPVSRGVMRSRDDRRRGAIIERLLCSGQADIRALPDREGVLHSLTPFIDRGLVRLTDNGFQLSEAAVPYARTIAACLDVYRQPQHARFSNAI